MLLGSRFFYIDHIIEKIAFTIFDVDFFYFIHLYTKMMLDSARSKHITSVVISAWHPSISKNRSRTFSLFGLIQFANKFMLWCTFVLLLVKCFCCLIEKTIALEDLQSLYYYNNKYGIVNPCFILILVSCLVQSGLPVKVNIRLIIEQQQ